MPVRERPHGAGTTYAGDPILGVVKNIDLGGLQRPAEIYVGILAATILFIATNAGVIGVSRLTYSMGQHRQLPEKLRQLHPRFRTPYIAIIVFGLIAIVTIIPGAGRLPRQDVRVRGDALVHDRPPVGDRAAEEGTRPRAALPRSGAGDDSRPRAAAVRRRSAASAPGSRGSSSRSSTSRRSIFGTIWLLLGIGTYVLYRRSQGLSLTQTTKVVMPKPIVEREVEYESVLVAFEGDDYSPEAVATAVKLAARRRRGHPRAGDHHGALELADRREHARAGEPGGGDHRLGPA